ncbi:BQ5605_C008g05120 [Microbotryum silenes-dioicae]|uniref:Protein YAE1 n=1 Tax=Microbotryum silenes-dioicae TaxID=796604 RepID=A0A2X0MGD3_9BASI|nr:BQ5605_C008g05120 [Microbotryum silenes-dioicae]
MMDNDDDSPWMQDDDIDFHHQPGSSTSAPSAHASRHEDRIAQQEYNKMAARYHDEGYRAGITSGKESSLQQGFDEGYSISAPLARQLGHLRGIATTLLAILTTNSGAKYSSPVLDHFSSAEEKERVVTALRDVVSCLGALSQEDVVPVDQEAEEHKKEHDGDAGENLKTIERNQINQLNAMMQGLGAGQESVPRSKPGLEECKQRLQIVLDACGMGSIPLHFSEGSVDGMTQ